MNVERIMKYLFLGTLCLSILAAVYIFFYEVVITRTPETYTVKESQSLTLMYPLESGGWTELNRMVEIPTGIETRIKSVLYELTQEAPNTNAFPPLPEKFPIRAVYVEEDRVYIDLDRRAVENFSGGAEEELIAISSILLSLGKNFSKLNTCQFLVAGTVWKTLGPAGQDAGHSTVYYPLVIPQS
jgi:hypothetical protein